MAGSVQGSVSQIFVQVDVSLTVAHCFLMVVSSSSGVACMSSDSGGDFQRCSAFRSYEPDLPAGGQSSLSLVALLELRRPSSPC